MRLPLPVVLAALVASAAANAQTSRDIAAAAALGNSHLGALTPLLTPPMTGRRVQTAQLALRYALREDGSDDLAHAVAGSAIFEVGTNSSVTLTAGVHDRDCAGCSAALLLGLGGDMRVFDAGERGGAGATFHVSLSGDVGFAQVKPGDAIALVLGVGAPVAMSITTDGETGMRIVPFITPMFGVGQLSADCPVVGSCADGSGTRFLVGGGIGLWNPATRVSASLGVQQVMIENSKTAYGVSVTVR